MKARIDYYCKPRKRNSGFAVEEICFYVDLPFVPAIGTMLRVTEREDYRPVADVMYDVPGEEGVHLIVGLEEPENDWELRSWRDMKREGWKLMPVPECPF